MNVSRSTPVDGFAGDGVWDSAPPSASPTRGGTLDWDDRAAMHAAACIDEVPLPRQPRRASPTRGGTLRWDELLPPVVRARYAAREVVASESPTRGGTLSWDALLAAVRDELASGDAPSSVPASLRLEVKEMVFEPPGRERQDSSTEEMLLFLSPEPETQRK